MHNDSILEVSENTLISKPLTASRIPLGIWIFCFTKISQFRFLTGNRNSTRLVIRRNVYKLTLHIFLLNTPIEFKIKIKFKILE